MSAGGKVDGSHQISNPHEDFAATIEGKWRRDPIVRSKINNKLQLKEAPYSRLFCDGMYGFSTKSVGHSRSIVTPLIKDYTLKEKHLPTGVIGDED